MPLTSVDLPLENAVDQRRFAAARNSRHHGERSQRKLGIDVLEIERLGPAYDQALFARGPSHVGDACFLAAAQVLARQRMLRLGDFAGCAVSDQLSAQSPRPRP